MMTKYAFKDSADGYYEVEIQDGEEAPEWSKNLTPCAVVAPVIDQKQVIQSQIDSIEFTSKMNRAIREFFILTAEATAAGKGVTPAQLYTANAAYKAVKDVDNQIVTLRNQLKALP